jgi:hypothetical protein
VWKHFVCKVMPLEWVLINRCLYKDTLRRKVMPERIYLNFNLRTTASTDVMRKKQEHLVEQATCVSKVKECTRKLLWAG